MAALETFGENHSKRKPLEDPSGEHAARVELSKQSVGGRGQHVDFVRPGVNKLVGLAQGLGPDGTEVTMTGRLYADTFKEMNASVVKPEDMPAATLSYAEQQFGQGGPFPNDRLLREIKIVLHESTTTAKREAESPPEDPLAGTQFSDFSDEELLRLYGASEIYDTSGASYRPGEPGFRQAVRDNPPVGVTFKFKHAA